MTPTSTDREPRGRPGLRRWARGSMMALALAGPVPVLAQHVLPVLTCERVATDAVRLKLVLLASEGALEEDVTAWIEFRDVSAPQQTVETRPPGLRTTRVPAAGAAWGAAHVQVISFGPYVLDTSHPAKIIVRGGLQGQPDAQLGALVVGQPDERGQGAVRFERALPAEPAGQQRRIFVVAAAHPVGPNSFCVKLAYFNCGERLQRDYWAFLHFETAETGENLPATTAMGLHPAGNPADAPDWRPDEVTVVTFGPYTIPAELEGPIYLRAGLYDHDGDGSRLAPLGSAERGRALVGRFVSHDGRPAFERILPWREADR